MNSMKISKKSFITEMLTKCIMQHMGEIYLVFTSGRNLWHWHENVKELHCAMLTLDILSTFYAKVERWWVVWAGTEAHSMV